MARDDAPGERPPAAPDARRAASKLLTAAISLHALALVLPWATGGGADADGGRGLVFLFVGEPGGGFDRAALTLGLGSITSLSLLVLARLQLGRPGASAPVGLLGAVVVLDLVHAAAMFPLFARETCDATACTVASVLPHAGWVAILVVGHLVAASAALLWRAPKA